MPRAQGRAFLRLVEEPKFRREIYDGDVDDGLEACHLQISPWVV